MRKISTKSIFNRLLTDKITLEIFNKDFYLYEYPDVRNYSDPLSHYLRYGRNERRSPNMLFDAAWYYEKIQIFLKGK